MTNNFITRDSGKRVEFAGGSVRDTQDGKPRYDLIAPEMLLRLAELMERGAAKYSADNWRKGQNATRSYASMFRHMMQWHSGDRSEDHLSAIIFNAMSIITMEKLAEDNPEFRQYLDLPFYQTQPEPEAPDASWQYKISQAVKLLAETEPDLYHETAEVIKAAGVDTKLYDEVEEYMRNEYPACWRQLADAHVQWNLSLHDCPF